MTYSLLADRYQVGEVIGRGGMSEVHRGFDRRLGRDVAVKMLRADLARHPLNRERFRREAQNAASLTHPCIVAVYDTGDLSSGENSVPYIVMEYVDGVVLPDMLRDSASAPGGRLSADRAVTIVAEICQALEFSHRHGVIHRDITPANVMITRTGAVKVMDFGIARAASRTNGATTATGVIGTAHYLSPEQIGGGGVDARSDVYAAGCVLYELLTGTPPFHGASPIAVAARHVREAPRPPSHLTPAIPAELDAVVLTALSKNPQNRYQSADQMRAALLAGLARTTALNGGATGGGAAISDPEVSDGLVDGPYGQVDARVADEARELAGAVLVDSRATSRVATGDRTSGVAPSATGRTAGQARVPVQTGPALFAPLPPVPPPPGRHIPLANPLVRRFWRLAGWGALGITVLTAVVLTVLVVTAPPPPAKVAVPDVSGRTLADAAAVLQERELVLGSVTEVDAPGSTPGRVVLQRPSERTQVEAGTAVNVEVERD